MQHGETATLGRFTTQDDIDPATGRVRAITRSAEAEFAELCERLGDC